MKVLYLYMVDKDGTSRVRCPEMGSAALSGSIITYLGSIPVNLVGKASCDHRWCFTRRCSMGRSECTCNTRYINVQNPFIKRLSPPNKDGRRYVTHNLTTAGRGCFGRLTGNGHTFSTSCVSLGRGIQWEFLGYNKLANPDSVYETHQCPGKVDQLPRPTWHWLRRIADPLLAHIVLPAPGESCVAPQDPTCSPRA